MDIRKILVSITGADQGLPCLEAAFTVGRYVGAHVEGLHARRNPRDALAYIGEGMTGAMIEELITAAEQESETLARRAREDFAAACEAAGFDQSEARPGEGRLTAHMRLETGREEDLITERGRVADLIVMPRAAKDADPPLRTVLEAALLESGKPLFVVPPEGLTSPLATAAIGWDGSAEVSRAVSHALPLLAKADRVVAITVPQGQRAGPSADDLVDYLKWHDIDSSTHELRSDYRMTGEALLSDALEIGAGLLIMGAYSHSRLRRLILGSATEFMLASSGIPVVMMD
jgi:nucleotide-binding universal stress UspA family protein